MSLKRPINIFIVDDNKVFTLALKGDIETVFKDVPIKINVFEIGEKCIERFKKVNPELVILDYNLDSKYPGAANGMNVLDWIKKENKETNVIMLTGDDNIDVAVKSFQHGASDYVVKTETQFTKINYSLLNMFKMMEAKTAARRYKRLLIAVFLCIAFLVGGITAIKIFDPLLLK